MKLQSLLLITLLFSTAAFAAKEKNPEEITFAAGGQLGLNFSSASITNPTINPSGRTGLALGGFLEIGLTEMFFLQPEMMYIQRGAETIVTVGTTTTSKLMFNYLEFPMLFKVKYPDYVLKPYAFIGPNIGILVAASFEQTQSSSTTIVERDIRSTSENFNFSLDLGIGAEYPILDQVDGQFSIKYSHGLTDVTTTSDNWKNTGWAILAGAKYRL